MIQNAKIYGDFFSPERILSYGRPWMFILGSRSVGKSTAIGIYTLKRYLEKHEKFIYIRRTDDEVMLTCRTFFNSPVTILRNFGYKIYEFKYDSKAYFIKTREDSEWEQCGYVIGLSQEYKIKSSDFEDVRTLIYDEFISRDPNKYLGSKSKTPLYEYDCVISLYQTVDRGIGRVYRNETRFFFLGNKSSYFTPVFMGLGIDEYIRTDTKICAPKGECWIVQQLNEVPATKDIENSFAYKLSDSRTKAYAFDNVAFDENMNFVEKINRPMQGIGNVKYNGHLMGIYILQDEGIMYVSNRKSQYGTIALTCGDQDKINYLMAKTYRDSYMMTALRDAYMMGSVRFETNRCKYDISNYFMLTP